MSDYLSDRNQFLELSKVDKNTGISRIVSIDEFIGPYSCLRTFNGVSYCRSNDKEYEFAKLKVNGKAFTTPNIPEDVKKEMLALAKEHPITREASKNAVGYIKCIGRKNGEFSRSINPKFKKEITSRACVSCGTHSEIECDHKNGLYNDLRVNNTKTQQLDDFQPLCKHCNDLKRQTIKNSLNTGKRHKATDITMLKIFGIDYISGGEFFDINDPNAMVGTYWYDPVAFMVFVKEKLVK